MAWEAYISHFHQTATIMVLRILTWIFPWQMAVFELLLRLSVHDSSPYAFIGPTIGGASVGIRSSLVLEGSPEAAHCFTNRFSNTEAP